MATKTKPYHVGEFVYLTRKEYMYIMFVLDISLSKNRYKSKFRAKPLEQLVKADHRRPPLNSFELLFTQTHALIVFPTYFVNWYNLRYHSPRLFYLLLRLRKYYFAHRIGTYLCAENFNLDIQTYQLYKRGDPLVPCELMKSRIILHVVG